MDFEDDDVDEVLVDDENAEKVDKVDQDKVDKLDQDKARIPFLLNCFILTNFWINFAL